MLTRLLFKLVLATLLLPTMLFGQAGVLYNTTTKDVIQTNLNRSMATQLVARVSLGVGATNPVASLQVSNAIGSATALARFGTNASGGLTINSNNAVGIGTTAPSQELHVVGDVLVSESLSVNGTGLNGMDNLTVTNSLNARTNVGSIDKDVTLLVINTYYTNTARRMTWYGTLALNPDAVTAAAKAAVYVDWDANGTWDELVTNAIPPGINAVFNVTFSADINPSARYMITNVGASAVVPAIAYSVRSWK